MSSSIEALRTVIRNEALSLPERKQAAQLLVSEQVDGVPEPAEDDAEVVELLTQPTADGPLGALLPMAREIANEKRNWARTGPTLLQARRFIHEKRRTELLKTIYRDRERHDLERQSASRRTLDDVPPSSLMRRNGYTPERLIAEES